MCIVLCIFRFIDNTNLFGANAAFEKSNDVAEETYKFGEANDNTSDNLFDNPEPDTTENLADSTTEATGTGNLFDMDTIAAPPDPLADVIDTKGGDAFNVPTATTETPSNPFASDTNITSSVPDVVASTGVDIFGIFGIGASSGGDDTLGMTSNNNNNTSAQNIPFGAGDFLVEHGTTTSASTSVPPSTKQDDGSLIGTLHDNMKHVH